MKQAYAWILSAVAGLAVALPAFGADAPAGKTIFQQRCSVCHTAEPNDGGGGQGPSLVGVFGRAAAGAAQFSYSKALQNSKLIWDAASLERFLGSPSSVVPGTSMLLAVQDEADRGNLVAYFQSLSGAQAAAAQLIVVPDVSAQTANWRLDAPGRLHDIRVASLPPPFATRSSNNRPSVVSRPPGAAPSLPPGFHIEPFATGLEGPRKMLLAPNGDIFITEIRAGRVAIMHPTADHRSAARVDVYLRDLRQPFGLAFYPNAQNPRWLYVAETNRITRYAYRAGDVKPRGKTQVVVAMLPSGSGHFTRDIAFAPDAKRMFVSVGSGSNVAESMPKKLPAEIAAWEAQHGLGAAWDAETNRAAVLEYDANSPAQGSLFATGIRNCVSLTVQPLTGALWCTTNERDGLGDDLVPDYSTRVKRGEFYGWPWYYMDSIEDPRLTGQRPDLAAKVSVPDVLYQSHSASLSMTFYAASAGNSAFPKAFVGDAFVAFHGSWNRSLRTGYKLVRVRMKNGEPTGDYEDFLTGFVVDDAHVWARPVATVELPDGSLLMSEDGNNVVYRISYGP
jgi:glucose/arabinose dehydrogenase/cytochrome c2